MKKILFSILTYLPMMLLLVGCSEKDSVFNTSNREVKVVADMPGSESVTRVGLSQSNSSLNLLTEWQEGDEIQLFILQNSQKFEVGKVAVTNISSNRKKASFSYQLPNDVDATKSYTLYGFCGIDGSVDTNGSSWYANCQANMIRTEMGKFKAPMFLQTTVNGTSVSASFQHIGTYEMLHVKNSSNKSITFRHKGFDIENPWYRSAVVLFRSDYRSTNPSGAWKGEAESEDISIAAGNTAHVISWYMPSGYKMKDAYLKANINGSSVVSSNKKSSNVTVERYNAYHQYVTWDGKELTFDNGDPTTQKIIDVAPVTFNFGTVNFGSSKTETFVVSNVGTADLTFRIQKVDGDFIIDESDKEVLLPVGAKKTFKVVFMPRLADKEYSQTAMIYTDAINGNQTLTFYGKSGKAKAKKISVSPLSIDFGKIAVDEGKSETFVVTNVGEDQLTFKVASTSGVFTISDSGKSFTLGVGQKKTFTAVFKPVQEETTYNQTVDITSDADNGTQYLRLTGQSEKQRIEQVIPPDIRDRMDDYITIYDGANPPNIEGDYLISPALLSYDSDNDFNVGYQFTDVYIRFLNQDMIHNTLDYQEKSGNSTSSGIGCFISGEGNNFSVFFNTEGVGNPDYIIHYKTALVISGTKTSSGIQNLEYAFVMVYKDYDPQPYYMAVGDFRVIIDGDGMAYNNSWSYAPRQNSPAAQKNLPIILQSGKLPDIKK